MNNRIVAERFLDNKKLVVTANPESQMVFINFYKDDKLLTDGEHDFIWDSDTKLKFYQDLSNFYGLAITKYNVENVAECFKKYLKYIKDDYFNYITINRAIKL